MILVEDHLWVSYKNNNIVCKTASDTPNCIFIFKKKDTNHTDQHTGWGKKSLNAYISTISFGYGQVLFQQANLGQAKGEYLQKTRVRTIQTIKTIDMRQYKIDEY